MYTHVGHTRIGYIHNICHCHWWFLFKRQSRISHKYSKLVFTSTYRYSLLVFQFSKKDKKLLKNEFNKRGLYQYIFWVSNAYQSIWRTNVQTTQRVKILVKNWRFHSNKWSRKWGQWSSRISMYGCRILKSKTSTIFTASSSRYFDDSNKNTTTCNG